jgi:transcription elongation factor SPT5
MLKTTPQGHRRKRRKRDPRNQFIDVEAEVDDEDEEEIEEEDDLIADEPHPDDLLDLPTGADRDDRRHRELDRQRELEASMDAEKQAAAYKERYGRRAAATTDSGLTPQRLLLPSVDDPTIWAVKCKQGKEREIIQAIMKRFQDRIKSRSPLKVCSAFERANSMPGYIYVEARKQADVTEACEGIPFCFAHSPMLLIPINEMPDLLRVTKTKTLEPGMYVRMKRPLLYANDLAEVQGVESNGLEVTVRIVPRLDYGANEDINAPANAQKRNRFGKPIGLAGPRPPQRLFNENEAKKRHMKYLNAQHTLGKRRWQYKGEVYEDGFLYKEVSITHLQTENVNPTLEEVSKFASGGEDGTENLDLAALAATLKASTVGAEYLPGDVVEIYQGEQAGVIGKAESVRADILSIKVTEGELKGQTIEAPAKTLRKLFREGDHVKVIGGSSNRDEVGMVLRVKGDRVTLVTDAQNTEVQVFSKDLRIETATTTTVGISKYDMGELVQVE